MDDKTRLLRLVRAAEYLDLHHDTLRRWAREGRVPYERLGGRGDLRFRVADLDALLHRRENRKTGEANRGR